MSMVKTADLSGAALDWAVGQVEKPKGFVLRDGTGEGCGWIVGIAEDASDPESWLKSWYQPSTDWATCGTLIENARILLCPPEGTDQWEASVESDFNMHYGPTPLIAACRAIVAAKLGDEVEVPAELAEVMV